jgi:hypothetical protein
MDEDLSELVKKDVYENCINKNIAKYCHCLYLETLKKTKLDQIP